MSFIKQIHPLMLLYQFAIVGLIGFILMMFNFAQQDALFYAVLLYFILFYTIRTIFTYNHRLGIRSYRKKEYDQAVDYFRKSGEFFDAHPKLDRYRFATLFSVSRLSYRELAESNAGFCYVYAGKLPEAEEAFRRALEINPSNPMAQSALEAIRKERGKRKMKKKK